MVKKRVQLVLQDGDLFLQTSHFDDDALRTSETSMAPFRLLAGAMHYFRIPPEYWEDRIIKCRDMGCNAIETYVAWNVHEPEPDQWTFEGFADIVRFVKLVEKHSLYMIVRVSPYICAEWDNGGMPYWLLRDRNVRLRSRHPTFQKAAKNFYNVVISKLKPFFATNGGPILAGQLENEYGCTNNDSEYLQAHYRYLRDDLGVDIPLFNGIWAEDRFLKAGKCEGTIVALNFNDGAADKFSWLEAATSSSNPRVCTEFWVGWFSAWGGHRYKPRESPETIATRFDELLSAKGHAILYLFHGGTNFGMRNGANIRADYCQFTITSYDYEAPLNEAGQITPYYAALQEVAKNHGHEPMPTPSVDVDVGSILPVPPPKSYPTIQVTSQALLLDQLQRPGYQSKVIASPYPLSMEECHQAYGYLLYRTHIPGPTPPSEGGNTTETLSINELRDRAHVFLDGSYLETLERTAGRCVAQTSNRFQVPPEGCQVDILVENQGRCNFPPFTQDFKGITENVFLGDCFVLSNWDHFPLSFSPEQLGALEWSPVGSGTVPQKNQPCFFRATWDLPTVPLQDTYIFLPQWQKGVVLVNGFNLGRYWNKGPQLSLYCPATVLVQGSNEIIIFEEEAPGSAIRFIDALEMKS
ncbi:galactosidase-1-like protein 3 [Seminavis robusta]|uniref:Beta-galactosidase n=1 Tax=Seminavis robusta TaxID=568900 RepID=A0A9N8DU82_9STRA|nr:galactosidase-1-like protein 3 [Seminavis robusta]|eukprot:Sro375_g129470.1 galactosidase-1-like protein 3 (638) ;mRNA; r:41577-43490